MTGLPRSQPEGDYAYRFQYADESAFVVYPDGTAFIEFKDGRREQKYGVIDNRIPLLIGMSAKPRQDRIEELTKALRGLDTLLDFSDDNVGETWTFEDTSSIQEAFAEAYRALSVPLERQKTHD